MAFITEWNQPAGNFTLPLSLYGSSYDFDVDFGDGSPAVHVVAANDPNATHNYLIAGIFQISITGICTKFQINYSSIRLRLINIISWGDINFSGGLRLGFYGCSNLISLPPEPITNCSEFGSAFMGCSSLVGIPGLIFRNCTTAQDFSSAFYGCSSVKIIPADLHRYTTNGIYFSGEFENCIALESSPDGLYKYLLTTYNVFSRVLYGCKKLKINPKTFYLPGEQATRFLNKNVSFDNAFERTLFTGETGTAPDLWNCNFGSTPPTITNCFFGAGNKIESLTNYYSIPTTWGATAPPKLTSLTGANLNPTTLKISIKSTLVVPGTDLIKCYVSKVLAGLIAVENSIELTTIDNINYEGLFYENVDCLCYMAAEYYVNGVLSETKNATAFFYSVAQKQTTEINIAAPNHITFTAPKLPYLHGTIFYNGYFYGSARGYFDGVNSGMSIIKLNAADYSDYITKTIYSNKTASTSQLTGLDQIVFCVGFLWCLSGGYLVRINPEDLDYMVFSAIDLTNGAPPIGTDGENLFITTNAKVYKINAALLLNSFASYSYNGSYAVSIPSAAILGNCTINQLHTIPAYSHSIIVDDQFFYLVMTTSLTANGYADGVYFYHLQKINKNTMITAGDVVIPKCTDDVVQVGDYIYLAPEYSDVTPDIFGSNYGLLAIKKSTLEIKYLKALHSDFNTANESDRQGYGVFAYNNRIIVQLVKSRKAIVINTDKVELWGADFPIGGATESIYSFKKDGVLITQPANELLLDNAGMVHITTWGTISEILKFPLSALCIPGPWNIYLGTQKIYRLFYQGAEMFKFYW